MQLVMLQQFASCLGSGFEIEFAAGAMPLTLTEVRPLPEHRQSGLRRQPFSLMFRSSSQVVLPQKLYRLRNATLGLLDIFLVPVARDRQGILYQAVFN